MSRLRWALLTAIAPISWGATYYVTRNFLPAEYPLWGSALRALPAGLLLMLVTRELPRGRWWWRSAVLGVLNIAAFLALVYVAAILLPTSVAASVMALSPIALMLTSWVLVGERPRLVVTIAAIIGIIGVVIMLFTGTQQIDGWGVAASLIALVLSSVGAILTAAWSEGEHLISITAWQLVVGGVVLCLTAGIVEGAPPTLSPAAWGAVAFVGLIATGVAYVVWFAGLARLDAGTVGIVGLLNPATGVLLGVALAGEILSVRQIVGLALVVIALVLGQWHPGSPVDRPGNEPATQRPDAPVPAVSAEGRV